MRARSAPANPTPPASTSGVTAQVDAPRGRTVGAESGRLVIERSYAPDAARQVEALLMLLRARTDGDSERRP